MGGQRFLFTAIWRWLEMAKVFSISAFCLIVLLSGCSEDTLYQRIDPVPQRTWQTAHHFTHDVVVTDTLSVFDFYLNLRIGENYPFSNIYLFVNTTFPNGNTARDTVECMLADPTGRWFGKGLGDLRDNQILFKPKVRFPQPGTYRFELEQGMRMEQLPEVFDVGISIFPTKGN